MLLPKYERTLRQDFRIFKSIEPPNISRFHFSSRIRGLFLVMLLAAFERGVIRSEPMQA